MISLKLEMRIRNQMRMVNGWRMMQRSKRLMKRIKRLDGVESLAVGAIEWRGKWFEVVD
jgi:hypothetical protein